MNETDDNGDDESENDNAEETDKIILKESESDMKTTSLCATSFWRIVAIIATIFVLIWAVFILRYYMKFLLLWLDHQNGPIQTIAIILIFCIVALPISVGYLVLVCVSGYLYGFIFGLPLVVSGANIGIFIAHTILTGIGHQPFVLRLTENPTAQAIKRLISGPSCFKIVLCARVTPIPFGLQNTIFALSNVNRKIYHLASMIGLFPTQILGVYLGTTLRAMQDAWEHKNFSSAAYVVITIQLLMDGCMMLWVGYKARKELMKILSEADCSGPVLSVV